MSTLADRVRNIFNKDKPESTETTTTNTATTTTTDTQPPAASMEIQSQHAVAKFGGTVIAETDNYEVVDGNIYFPPDSLKQEYFRETETHTTCPWKGLASYYTIDVDGTRTRLHFSPISRDPFLVLLTEA